MMMMIIKRMGCQQQENNCDNYDDNDDISNNKIDDEVYYDNTRTRTTPGRITRKMKGLILFPGAFVDHTSYAIIASKIADSSISFSNLSSSSCPPISNESLIISSNNVNNNKQESENYSDNDDNDDNDNDNNNNSGIIVVVPSLEPFRLASTMLGADDVDLQRIIKDVTIIYSKLFHSYQQQQRKNKSKNKNFRTRNRINKFDIYHNNNNIGIDDITATIDWSIGGHSLGAYAALRLAPCLKREKEKVFLQRQEERQQQEHKRHGRIWTTNPKLTVSSVSSCASTSTTSSLMNNETSVKVILWAAGNIPSLLTNLNDYYDYNSNQHDNNNKKDEEKGSPFEVLVLHGSNDAYCTFPTTDQSSSSILTSPLLHKFLSHLPPPPYTQRKILKGGTHANFASYNVPNSKFDGIPGISNENQLNWVQKETVDFING